MRKRYILTVLLILSFLLTGCGKNPYRAGIKALEDGEYSKAVTEFQEAIEEEKNLADSYRGLGIAQWEEEEYEASYQAFEQALLEGTEKTATIYSLMGNCAMETEQYAKAVEAYETALTMKDISEELIKETEFNLIAAYEYAGEVDAAKEKAAAYIEKYPEDEEVVREAEFLETR